MLQVDELCRICFIRIHIIPLGWSTPSQADSANGQPLNFWGLLSRKNVKFKLLFQDPKWLSKDNTSGVNCQLCTSWMTFFGGIWFVDNYLSRDNWVYPQQCTHGTYRAFIGISHRGTLVGIPLRCCSMFACHCHLLPCSSDLRSSGLQLGYCGATARVLSDGM